MRGKIISSFFDKVPELVYPSALYCICCGNLIDDTRTYHLCDHCIAHIRWNGEAITERRGLKMLCCTRYGLYERTLIFALKYNGKKYIARDLARMMFDRLALEELEYDVIVPVPMFYRKERQRGFNQAALMGRYLGKLTEKPCIEKGLLRTASTRPMRGLSPTERQLNVKDKFAVNQFYQAQLQGKTVLLLDDFFTTGSTAFECARVLRQIGVKDVYFLAFAAG